MKRVVHVFIFNQEDSYQTFEFMGRIDNKLGFVVKKHESYLTEVVLLADEKVVDGWVKDSQCMNSSLGRNLDSRKWKCWLRHKFIPEHYAEEIGMLKELTKLHKKSGSKLDLEKWILEEAADFASENRELAGQYLTERDTNT